MKRLFIIAVLLLAILFVPRAHAESTVKFTHIGTYTGTYYSNYQIMQVIGENNKKHEIIFNIPKPWTYYGKERAALILSEYCNPGNKASLTENGEKLLEKGRVVVPFLAPGRSDTYNVGGYCGKKEIAMLHIKYYLKANAMMINEIIPGQKNLTINAFTKFQYFIVHRGQKSIYTYAPKLYKALPPVIRKTFKSNPFAR